MSSQLHTSKVLLEHVKVQHTEIETLHISKASTKCIPVLSKHCDSLKLTHANVQHMTSNQSEKQITTSTDRQNLANYRLTTRGTQYSIDSIIGLTNHLILSEHFWFHLFGQKGCNKGSRSEVTLDLLMAGQNIQKLVEKSSWCPAAVSVLLMGITPMSLCDFLSLSLSLSGWLFFSHSRCHWPKLPLRLTGFILSVSQQYMCFFCLCYIYLSTQRFLPHGISTFLLATPPR